MKKFTNLYSDEIVPYLTKIFNYKNLQQIPNIKKIQINRGLGINAQNSKTLKKTISEFRDITGQEPIVTKSKKSIAAFKLRENIAIGVTVTLRGEKMYSFLDRLINLALPRIRDFQGLDSKKFDKFGNYNFGINDQLIFPEINYETVDQMLGYNITIVTSAKTSKESFELLNKMGLPFCK
jgi:large subunit ribosomal protein L5